MEEYEIHFRVLWKPLGTFKIALKVLFKYLLIFFDKKLLPLTNALKKILFMTRVAVLIGSQMTETC